MKLSRLYFQQSHVTKMNVMDANQRCLINARRACARGLQYLLCVCLCVCSKFAALKSLIWQNGPTSMFFASLAARPSPRCLPLCGRVAKPRGRRTRRGSSKPCTWLNFLEFHYSFRWYDRSRVAWADFVTRMAVVHVHRRKSHEYHWNESLQWNLIGYSKFNQVQSLLDPLRVRRPRGFATWPHSGQQRGEGLAARLVFRQFFVVSNPHKRLCILLVI